MQTHLADTFKNTAIGQEAKAVIRNCVHCGFCNATCPTYLLLGDELDGPRGRIYLIKQLLEGATATQSTQLHLDRCLTCNACETTCPSGVEYHKLLEIGRGLVSQQLPRSLLQRLIRKLILLLADRRKAAFLFWVGRVAAPLLPAKLQRHIPKKSTTLFPATATHNRKMLLLDGCVQPGASPQINAAAAHVFDRLEIQLISAKQSGCCGALQHHLDDPEGALQRARNNIDAWWPLILQGAEAIVITASGCAPMVKDYGRLLAHDDAYSDRAAKVSSLARDLGAVLQKEAIPALKLEKRRRIAFHAPCTLQHGQGLAGVVESILDRLGFELTEVVDAHLCCGSAGAWSILHPELSGQLKTNKLNNLQRQQPELIATANIGCLLHLQSESQVPVVHWIELISGGLRPI